MFRPATSSDLDLLLSARASDPVGIIEAERYRRDLDLNQYRREWSWIYEVEGLLHARALWWGQPTSDHPLTLDCLWVGPSIADPETLAGDLIAAGHHAFHAGGMVRLPDFIMDISPGWRANPDTVAAVAWRREAAVTAGLNESIERLNFAWTPESPVPGRKNRLVFGPADDAEFLDAFRSVATGSLDVHTLADIADMGPEAQAMDDLEFYLSLPGDRAMWRIATEPNGARVGFIIPSRSAYDASVSYLGVAPEHRGRGFVDDLLAEITIMHSDNGAPRITGTTDTTNAPMADAFERAGYVVTATRIVMEARPTA